MSDNVSELVTDFTDADNYAPAVRAKAYERFLQTDMSPMDIAIDLGVNEMVIATWIRRGGWRKRKKELEMELFESAESDYRKLLIETRLPTLQRHLRISEKLELAVEKLIDTAIETGKPPSDMALKRLAETLSSATSVSARAAGITDKPFESKDNKQDSKTPLIMIGVEASVPPGREDNAIDVDCTEEDQ